MIASPPGGNHAVFKNSDNLDSTRGRSSTQIKRHIFGKTKLTNNLITSLVSRQLKATDNPEANNAKRFQVEAYKPKPKNKEKDQQLFCRLYNDFKKQKEGE